MTRRVREVERTGALLARQLACGCYALAAAAQTQALVLALSGWGTYSVMETSVPSCGEKLSGDKACTAGLLAASSAPADCERLGGDAACPAV